MSTNSITFPSLADPTRHGYVLQKDWEKYYDAVRRCGSARFVSDKAGIYDTYGDGLVQHSPDVPVLYDRLAAEFVWGQLCLCTPGCCDGALRAFCSRVQFTDLCRQLDIWVDVSPAVHCKIAPNDDPGESQHVASSVAALEQIIISAVAQRRAQDLFDATLHNLAIRKASTA